MITVNLVGVSLFSIYCLFYLMFAKPKCCFAVQFGLVLLAITGMLVWVEYFPSTDYLGVACMTFNIINFGAPLAGLGVVLRRRCCDTLPLPMCIVNLLVSSQWFLYGNIVLDPYIMAPNGIGMGLAVLQLSLFVIFPRKERGKSLLSRIIERCIHSKNEEEKGDRASTQTTSTVISFPAGNILRKISESLEKGSTGKHRSGSFVEVPSKFPTGSFRSRISSVPDISKHKWI